MPLSTDGGRDAESLTAASTVDNCLVGYSVRLGGSISIPVPFVQDVGTVTATTSSPDLTVLPVRKADGRIAVSVTARHAATRLGQTTVNISESTLGKASDRAVTVYISPITAASAAAGGKLTNPGTSDEPFLTFQAAAAAAGPGDTIILKSLTPIGQDALGNDVEQAEQNFLSAPAVILQNNVTVKSSTTTTRSQLHMPIVLKGSAVLDDLDIEEPRLVINTPSSNVTLRNSTIVGCGITIAAAASGATLHIINGGPKNGELRNDPPATDLQAQTNALLIEADHANVTIENGGSVYSNSNSSAVAMAAIRSDGVGSVIDIHGGTVVENSSSQGSALELPKLASLTVDTVSFIGDVHISDPSSVASFTNATFNLSNVTGDAVLTGLDAGRLFFDGTALTVVHSTFAGLSIVQTAGRVTLRNSSISGYTQQGYILKAGYLDAGTLTDLGLQHVRRLLLS